MYLPSLLTNSLLFFVPLPFNWKMVDRVGSYKWGAPRPLSFYQKIVDIRVVTDKWAVYGIYMEQ